MHPTAILTHIPFGGAGWIVTTGCCLGSVRRVGRAGMTMAFAWRLGWVSQKARNRGLGWINGFGLLRLRVTDDPFAVEENVHLKIYFFKKGYIPPHATVWSSIEIAVLTTRRAGRGTSLNERNCTTQPGIKPAFKECTLYLFIIYGLVQTYQLESDQVKLGICTLSSLPSMQ